MVYRTTPEHLTALVAALQKPIARRLGAPVVAVKALERIAAQGWAYRSEIEDLLLLLDRRLDPYEAGDPKKLAELFTLCWQDVATRPRAKTSTAVMFTALAAPDVAQLLIHLEACGFQVDPEPLVGRLLPGLKHKPLLTSSELSILWFSRLRHRAAPLSLTTHARPIPAAIQAISKLPSGYRAEIWLDQEGALARLTVNAPKFRRRPSPVEVTCPACSVTFQKGDPESSASHRRQHKQRMVYLDPQPHPQLLHARQQETEPELVTTHSPVWKHREMYSRALAFKREFGYDFVQWQSAKGDNDPDVRGFLLSDNPGAIVGACAFRRRDDQTQAWWALQWVWICPLHRRRKHLAQRWSALRERFGDFKIEAPVSDAMRAFAIKYHDDALLEG